ncbi:hypothetical protein DIPPA_31367 [Diplonema papillatum]|nr:hypothetical protein DIPPA_31367 [Diplonema papillatum]
MLRKVTGLLCPPAGEIRRTVTQQRCLDWAAGVGRLEWVVELEVPGSGKRSAELFKELLAAAPSRFDSEVNTFVFLKTRHVCLGSLRSSDRANAEDVRQATDLVSFVCRETNAAVGPLVLSSLLTAQVSAQPQIAAADITRTLEMICERKTQPSDSALYSYMKYRDDEEAVMAEAEKYGWILSLELRGRIIRNLSLQQKHALVERILAEASSYERTHLQFQLIAASNSPEELLERYEKAVEKMGTVMPAVTSSSLAAAIRLKTLELGKRIAIRGSKGGQPSSIALAYAALLVNCNADAAEQNAALEKLTSLDDMSPFGVFQAAYKKIEAGNDCWCRIAEYLARNSHKKGKTDLKALIQRKLSSIRANRKRSKSGTRNSEVHSLQVMIFRIHRKITELGPDESPAELLDQAKNAAVALATQYVLDDYTPPANDGEVQWQIQHFSVVSSLFIRWVEHTRQTDLSDEDAASLVHSNEGEEPDVTQTTFHTAMSRCADRLQHLLQPKINAMDAFNVSRLAHATWGLPQGDVAPRLIEHLQLVHKRVIQLLQQRAMPAGPRHAAAAAADDDRSVGFHGQSLHMRDATSDEALVVAAAQLLRRFHNRSKTRDKRLEDLGILLANALADRISAQASCVSGRTVVPVIRAFSSFPKGHSPALNLKMITALETGGTEDALQHISPGRLIGVLACLHTFGTARQSAAVRPKQVGPVARLMALVLLKLVPKPMADSPVNPALTAASPAELAVVVECAMSVRYRPDVVYEAVSTAIALETRASNDLVFALAKLSGVARYATSSYALFAALSRGLADEPADPLLLVPPAAGEPAISRAVLLYLVSRDASVKRDLAKGRSLPPIQAAFDYVAANVLEYSLHEYSLILISAGRLSCTSQGLVRSIETGAVELLERTAIDPVTVAVFLCVHASIHHIPPKEVLNGACLQLKYGVQGRRVVNDSTAAVGLMAALSQFAQVQPLVLEIPLFETLTEWLQSDFQELLSLDDTAILLVSLSLLPDTHRRSDVIRGILPAATKAIQQAIDVERGSLPALDPAWAVAGVVWALANLKEDIATMAAALVRFADWQGSRLGPEQAVSVAFCFSKLFPRDGRRVMAPLLHGASARWEAALRGGPELVVAFCCVLACFSDAVSSPAVGGFADGLSAAIHEQPAAYTCRLAALATAAAASQRLFACSKPLLHSVSGNLYATDDFPSIVMFLWGVCHGRSREAAVSLCAAVSRRVQLKLVTMSPDDVAVLLLCFAVADTFPESAMMVVDAGTLSLRDVSPLHGHVALWALAKAGRDGRSVGLTREPTMWQLGKLPPLDSPEMGRMLFDFSSFVNEVIVVPDPAAHYSDLYLES